MITTTFSTIPGVLHYVAQLSLLAGVALIMFVPFFPGLAVMLAGVLAYVGYQSLMAKALVGMDVTTLVTIVVLTAIGLSSGWWSEKLGLRFTYLNQQVMLGAIVGSFIGIFLFGMLGMLFGLILGTAVMELRGGKPFADSMRQGVAALLSMLGPRGFQLVMALLVGGLALSHMGR